MRPSLASPVKKENVYSTSFIKEHENQPFLTDGKDFIDERVIEDLLHQYPNPDKRWVRDILAKSLSLRRLEPFETAILLNVDDTDLLAEMYETALEVKTRVYGPRIVTFAPLYCANLCENSCLYCGFRKENQVIQRRSLTLDEVQEETKSLVSKGHKRLVVVYGEHSKTGAQYIADTIRVIYDTKVGNGEIRRVNINAAPQAIKELKIWKDVGVGTLQVFQETYHHKTYRKMHPRGNKSNYQWRLYALHRAQQAGIDDVAIGALFGLYAWKFEVMGLMFHTIDLENKFGGIGPHTISFPRMEPAANTPLTVGSNSYKVSDDDFKKLVAVIRLSVPYTGMIITARESAHVRMEVIDVGCTQTDASSRIGIGSYSDRYDEQESQRQQFILGDTRELDEVIRELASKGYITSFCTAGYRCGRTGDFFMKLAKKGKVRNFCMPNAVLTFKEYLLDYASAETKKVGEQLIETHINMIQEDIQPVLKQKIKETENGKRDLRF